MMIIIIIICYAKCNTVAAYCTAVGLRVNSVHVSFDCSFVWIRLLLSARASENEHTVQYAHTVYEQITKSSQPTNQPTMIERNNEQKKNIIITRQLHRCRQHQHPYFIDYDVMALFHSKRFFCIGFHFLSIRIVEIHLVLCEYQSSFNSYSKHLTKPTENRNRIDSNGMMAWMRSHPKPYNQPYICSQWNG